MGCQCANALEEVMKEVENIESRMKMALEDGPYWVRMVSSGFLQSFPDKHERLDCNCPAATRINAALDLLTDQSIRNAVSQVGGGSIAERAVQEASYEEFKSIITGQQQRTRSVKVIMGRVIHQLKNINN